MYANFPSANSVLLFYFFSLQNQKNFTIWHSDGHCRFLGVNLDEFGQSGLVKFLSVKKVVQTLHVWFETKLHNLVWLSFNKFQGLQNRRIGVFSKILNFSKVYKKWNFGENSPKLQLFQKEKNNVVLCEWP